MRRDRFDDRRLSQVIGPRKAGGALERADRIRLLGEAAQALLEGRMPDRPAALFLGGAIESWLREGGDLERAYFRVRGPRGSRRTPSAIWRAHRDDGRD